MTAKNTKVVKEEVPADTLDLVVTNKSVGFLETNIEALETYVKQKLEEYKPENYMGDADLAKKDRAELNKARDKIARARKDLIAELMKPYNDFETRCKALEKMIDSASGSLDEIVKLKEQEEKDRKKQQIEYFWQTKGFDLFPLDKIFNPKWLNKTFKESDILDEMDARIKKTYTDLKTCEKYAEMYGLVSDDVKAHYLMNLNIEETITFCDELQRQKEIAQKEAEQRAEREHNETIALQKKQLAEEQRNYMPQKEADNLASLALAEASGTEVEQEVRKEYVITVKCFADDLLRLKAQMNSLGIEFSVEELTF